VKPDNPHDRGKAARATGSRAELVELLGRGVVTVADLAKQLRLTHNAVRFHLASLQRAGLVRATGTRPGKRRAHATYKLTKQADQRFPNAYKHSLREILAELKHRYTPNTVIAILRSAGNRLAKDSSRGRKDLSVRNRASKAKKLLEALGGSIAIEPHGTVSLLRADGCPLGAVVAAHPEVCNMVETFLARSTGASVRQQCHHGPNPRCQFQIRSST
jgi:predicted ArsR family transcriptional regulator